MPVSLMTIPMKKLRNSGAATGKSRHRMAFVMIANTSFCLDVILLFLYSLTMALPLMLFGMSSLMRYG